ncbi:MAG: xanthine dehydrogenase family protein molybdopterin-binding subunit [Deltaproteobacteria bacterium]|nr:xanthine dehydrogenase family protein molybdopterin-binding subunit [Deltaproteobacteria bacterium]
MSNDTTLTRRRFLEVTTLVGGGLVVGCQIQKGPSPEIMAARKPSTTPFEPNAWISIASNGTITFTCHRNEMGQDVHTSLAMLLAEELEVDPREVTIVQAPVDPTHYINALLGGQITGGSTSIRDAWEPLRRAGATARTLLVATAAARWKVPVSECRAENAAVHHATHGSLRYAELADEAAHQPLPADVALKPASAFRVIGKPLDRLDGADKARGRTRYGIDVVLPGMLRAALAACPVLGGKVVSFDAAKAKSRKGVRAVVDLGEGVAVVADHYFTARQALADLDIRWDEGPAAKLDTGTILASLEHAASSPGAVVRQAGDAAGTLARRRSGVLSARYSTQMLSHMTLEPQSCVALVRPNGETKTPGQDGVEIWASTQFPQGAQGIAAAAAGVDPARVKIHAQPIGGGFGRRLDVDFVGQAVKIAMAVPGTPVKLLWTREDDVTHDFYRPPSLHVVRGAVEGGRIAALEHKLVSPSITNRAFPGVVKDGIDPFMTEGTVNLSYSIPNLDLRSVIQEVGIRVGYWRSVSHAQNAFAIESFVDELARAAGRDPVGFRLAMLAEMPRQAAVLERAAKEAGYATKTGPGRAFGVASMECYGSHVALVAELSGTAAAIKLERLTFAVDCGIAIHPDQVLAQIEGAAVTGLMGALRTKVTVQNGRVEQSNFDDHPIPRMSDVPPIHVVRLENEETPGGIGEVGTPLVAPALANGVFALTGKRIRSLPLEDGGVEFV